jgi:predicted nucleic acid-binding protein
LDLISLFHGKRIFLDTAPIIYYIEEQKRYNCILERLFKDIADGKITAGTSTISLLEVLVLPYKTKNERLGRQYKQIMLHSTGFTVFSITDEIADHAARIRAKYAIRTPDAIQIAAGLCTESKYFITNDRTFKKINEIKIILLDDHI